MSVQLVDGPHALAGVEFGQDRLDVVANGFGAEVQRRGAIWRPPGGRLARLSGDLRAARSDDTTSSAEPVVE